jgi:hypothetical protein
MRGRKPYVAAPLPGKKTTDRSVHNWINGDDIGIKVFRDNVDVSATIALKDHYRRLFGLPACSQSGGSRNRSAPSRSPYATTSLARRWPSAGLSVRSHPRCSHCS